MLFDRKVNPKVWLLVLLVNHVVTWNTNDGLWNIVSSGASVCV